MDLEILEALALSDDRNAARETLLPGSEDRDYYTALHAQHRGALDEADRIIDVWPNRHGNNGNYRRLKLRQLMYRVVRDPNAAADEMRDWLGVQHWHEPEARTVDPTRPTRLLPGQWNGAELLVRARDYSSDLGQVTYEGLYELLGMELGSAQRRALLQKIDHTTHPALIGLVVADLDKRPAQFGQLRIHGQLTLDQLHELAKQMPEIRTQARWIEFVVMRMRPIGTVDLGVDRDARETYLGELWSFVKGLGAGASSLKAHVLAHLLDALRRRDFVDDVLFAQYLELPRNTHYAITHKNLPSDSYVQALDYSNVTGLGAAPNEEALIKDLLERRLANAQQFARYLEASWFDTVIAEAQLLSGSGDSESATRTLGPARAAEIRERVELAWSLHDKIQFAADEPVVLDVEVKHVPELVVKVFRIDPLAYFAHMKNPVGIDLDLDGLAASHEIVLKYAEPPVRRVRRRIELPMCARPGVYVIDLIGNGMSSRALIHKGRLRYATRVGAAGTVVSVLDEQARPLPGARAWINEREYVADERGTFAIPFAQTRTAKMLLMHGDLVRVDGIALANERYRFDLHLAVDRQQFTAGRTAVAIARVKLYAEDQPASLALLERPSWDVTLTDRHGVTTTKSQPLVLEDHVAASLEIPLGDDVASVAVAVRGTVRQISTQQDLGLAANASLQIANMYGSNATEALYLARTKGGYVLSALGKSGEPRAQRTITLSLTHRWAIMQMNYELATDARGRVELGELAGCTKLQATFGSMTQTWSFDDDTNADTDLVIVAGSDAVIPIPAQRTSAELIRAMSLVELRANVPRRHVKEAAITASEGAIRIGGLPEGEYHLRVPGMRWRIIVIAAIGVAQNQALARTFTADLTPRPPTIAAITIDTSLVIQLADITPQTRVHVIATRFAPTQITALWNVRASRRFHADPLRGVTYVIGRELGDEYRYVLDRRTQRRYPSLLLDKPSLLLNPWARRATSTSVQDAKAGRAFAPPPPAQAPAMPGYGGGGPRGGVGGYDDLAYVGYDFLPEPPAVFANLVPVNGAVSIAIPDLGHATAVTIIVDDPQGATTRNAYLPEQPLEPRDLRLKLALDPARHASQAKKIQPLRAGETLEIRDLATAKVHLIDTIERAHSYLLALRDDATLREWSWLATWNALSESDRRMRYSKHACHELHLFLYFKDRPFFDGVVRAYLANKRTKTFIDDYLLDANLAPYLEPGQLEQLNAFELALLARKLRIEPALVRILGDRVAIIPPDPSGDTRLVDALLGASSLEGGELHEMQLEQEKAATVMADMAMPFGGPPQMPMASAAPAPASRARLAAPKMAKKRDADELMAKEEAESSDDYMDAEYMRKDLDRREAQAPMFRPQDKTQELAEHNWFQRTPQQSDASMIAAHRLWRDFANHTTGSFLSPWLGLATGSFAEMVCALAVIDLPFTTAKHEYTQAGGGLTIKAGSNALAGLSQLVYGELQPSTTPLIVGQSFVRTDDRYRWVDGEQVDKYVTELAAGVVYTCLIVVANPTSSRQRVAALIQIPRGSIAVGGAQTTQTVDILLEPYAAHGHEVSFYFPAAGTFGHFPVHVSRLDQIVAAAPAMPIVVTPEGVTQDATTSWPWISQHGELAAVLAYLLTANLAELDLSKIYWRLRDRTGYEAILQLLEGRRFYDATVWGYALAHRDQPRIVTWLRAQQQQLGDAGPVLEMIERDAEDTGAYEHLEYAPLTNARAHKLGPKLRILNEGLAAQYARFLELVAHRPAPTTEDLLAATSYFTAQDRVDAALYTLGRVQPGSVTERMQHAYLAAYAACLAGDPARARELIGSYVDHPVDRWRNRFAALAQMLDELAGGAAKSVDKDSRTQQQSELAATQPTFEISVDRDGVVIHQQHVQAIELRYFEMDVELLFSRQPFVQSDVSRFSYIEPGHREQVTAPSAEQRVPWPAQLRGKNVVVEAVGAGLRKARIHYANDLAPNIAHQYGQVRVVRASDRAPLAATYIKVYARQQGGNVTFFKDGYTDLRGWFDYATLSTDELDRVDRFAILVASDQAGSAILEAAPPGR
ncbi:MAG: hypothetical protein QM831_20100 [Kofleriaceae bacterium]